MKHRYSLLLSSALLYGLAYVAPQYMWWTTTVFLTPLFYLVLHDKLTAIDGALWTLVAFTMHLSGVLCGLVARAGGGYLVRPIPALAVLGVGVMYGTIWFLCSCRVSMLTRSPWPRLFLWVVTTWAFFLWLEHGSLVMLGAWEGYLLVNPLVPLVQYPALLYFLPKIGSACLLFIFIITQAVAAADWRWSALIMSFWVTGIMLWDRQSALLPDCARLVCATNNFHVSDNITRNGRAVRDYCKLLINEYPEVTVVIFPETALRCPHLFGQNDIVALLNGDHLGEPVTIIMGGLRQDGDKVRNTVYWVHDGAVVDLFDKRHAMALTERAPQEYLLGASSLIRKNYFEDFAGITPHKNTRPVWRVAESFWVIPYICSELFFNNKPDHAGPGIIVASCHDGWIKQDFMRYQMLMGARYRAIQWQTPIIYVAYFYQGLCSPTGSYQALKTFSY